MSGSKDSAQISLPVAARSWRPAAGREPRAHPTFAPLLPPHLGRSSGVPAMQSRMSLARAGGTSGAMGMR